MLNINYLGNSPEVVNRLQIRIKDLFKECEICEANVAADANRVTILQSEYFVDISNVYKEIGNVEKDFRMKNSKEYIERFDVAATSMVSRIGASTLLVLKVLILVIFRWIY